MEPLVSGFYWYISDEDDDGAFRDSDPTVVEVYELIGRRSVQHIGIEMSFGIDEHHGKFIGPIDAPKDRR